MKYILFLLLALPGSLKAQLSAQADSAAATVFFIVRHAEKNMQESSNDPSLSPEGRARAERLAVHLRDAQISAVYATDTKRARLTGEPAARQHGLKVLSYGNDLDAETKRLLEKHGGERILVVGHSNTVPLMVNELAGTDKYKPNEDYDALYIVILAREMAAQVIVLRY